MIHKASAILLLAYSCAAPVRAEATALAQAAGEAGRAAAIADKTLQDRHAPVADPVLAGLRARFSGAPSSEGERKELQQSLTSGVWRCRQYLDGAWKDDDGSLSYQVPWLSRDEVREYDIPKQAGRPYLGYRVTPVGLAGMYGFIWLRMLDRSTFMKEYSDTSGQGPGLPSLVVPTQNLRWYKLCTKTP